VVQLGVRRVSVKGEEWFRKGSGVVLLGVRSGHVKGEAWSS
jgi:hypothetical protein